MLFFRSSRFVLTLCLSWLITIFRYYQFVIQRREVKNKSIWPGTPLMMVLLTGIVFITVCLIVYADPNYLRWLMKDGGIKGTWYADTTKFGDSSWILYLTGAVLILMSLWSSNRIIGSRFVYWHNIFLRVYFAFTSIAISGLLAVIFKNVIGRARPDFTTIHDYWIVSPFTDNYVYASFPSGHSTTAGALAVVLILLKPRTLYVMVPVAIWLGISRMAIGVHFPSDVFFGLMLGIVFTWLYARTFAKKRLLFTFSEKALLGLKIRSTHQARRKIARQKEQMRKTSLKRKSQIMKNTAP